MREPRRAALGILFEIFGRDAEKYAAGWFTPRELETLASMLEGRVNAPRTSSMGRLFDAIAAMCGLPAVISFEGQAAMGLEFAADESEQTAYCFSLSRDGAGDAATPRAGPSEAAVLIDWEPVVRAVLSDLAAGIPVGRISARFHNALADMAVAVARRAANAMAAATLPCVLSGGCFQNALLRARVASRLAAASFSVYTHQQTPPGDGGIALGQVMVALGQLQGSADVSRSSG